MGSIDQYSRILVKRGQLNAARASSVSDLEDLSSTKEIAAEPDLFLYSGSIHRAVYFAKDGNSRAFPFLKGSTEGIQGV